MNVAYFLYLKKVDLSYRPNIHFNLLLSLVVVKVTTLKIPSLLPNQCECILSKVPCFCTAPSGGYLRPSVALPNSLVCPADATCVNLAGLCTGPVSGAKMLNTCTALHSSGLTEPDMKAGAQKALSHFTFLLLVSGFRKCFPMLVSEISFLQGTH